MSGAFPPKPDDWKTGSQLKEEKGGDKTVWNKKLRQTAEKISGEIAQGLAEPVSYGESMTDNHLGGMRQPERGKAAFAASPDLVRAVEEEIADFAKPDDWKTGSELSREKGGKRAVWDRNLKEVAEKIIGDIAEVLGEFSDKAARKVDNLLGGMRQPEDSQAAFAASPDLVRAAEKVIADKTQPDDWRTANQLKAEKGGNKEAWERDLIAVAEKISGDIAATLGVFPDKSDRLTDDQIGGMREPKGGGKPAFAASPDLVRAVEVVRERKHLERLSRGNKQDPSPER